MKRILSLVLSIAMLAAFLVVPTTTANTPPDLDLGAFLKPTSMCLGAPPCPDHVDGHWPEVWCDGGTYEGPFRCNECSALTGPNPVWVPTWGHNVPVQCFDAMNCLGCHAEGHVLDYGLWGSHFAYVDLGGSEFEPLNSGIPAEAFAKAATLDLTFSRLPSDNADHRESGREIELVWGGANGSETISVEFASTNDIGNTITVDSTFMSIDLSILPRINDFRAIGNDGYITLGVVSSWWDYDVATLIESAKLTYAPGTVINPQLYDLFITWSSDAGPYTGGSVSAQVNGVSTGGITTSGGTTAFRVQAAEHDAIVLTATPESRYRFDSWSSDDPEYDEYGIFIPEPNSNPTIVTMARATSAGLWMHVTFWDDEGGTPILWGDINGDGIVDSMDILTLRLWVPIANNPAARDAFLANPDNANFNLTAGDANGDGIVDSMDILELRRWVPTPAGDRWQLGPK